MSGFEAFSTATKAVSELIKELTNIVGILEKNMDAAWRISDKVRYRWERKKLRDLIYSMEALWKAQRGVPRLLNDAADMIEELNSSEKPDEIWRVKSQLSGNITHVMHAVAEARDFLLAHHSDHMSNNPKVFSNLIEAIFEREEFLKAFTGADDAAYFGINEHNLEAVRALSSEYQRLIDEMVEYRDIIGRISEKQGMS